MARKRYIIEIGTGIDLHGGDVTKAAIKAIEDAISRSCLCGMFDILGLTDPNQMEVEVKIGCPYSEKLDKERVIQAVPFGLVNLEVVSGGISVKGLELPALGEGSNIVVAVAALTVYVITV